MLDLASDYTVIRGEMINLTASLTLLNMIGGDVDTYGANTTVNYITGLFDGITVMKNNIPVMSVGNNDFILIEMTLPEEDVWYENHNLLLFTPYFYSAKKDQTEYTIFGSCDESLLFDRSEVTPGGTINICITARKDVAEHYQDKGYFISKIPSDYNQAENDATYNFLIRVGSIEPRIDDTVFFRAHIKMSYHKYTGMIDHPAFHSELIRASSEKPGLPEKSLSQLRVLRRFAKIEAYLDEVFGTSEKYLLYPYMSNMTTPPVNYAIESFYQSFNLPEPINIQANNTKENYFMSDSIDIAGSHGNDRYLHLLFLNQNASGAALTSNVQIYDNNAGSHQLLNLPGGNSAYIATAPDLPSFAEDDYPYVDGDSKDSFPDFGIVSYSMAEIRLKNLKVDSLLVVERFSYNPQNLNVTVYDRCQPSIVYIGPALTDEEMQYLQRRFPRIDLDSAVSR